MFRNDLHTKQISSREADSDQEKDRKTFFHALDSIIVSHSLRPIHCDFLYVKMDC